MIAGTEWIGRSRSAADHVTPRLVAEFNATLGPLHCGGDATPGLQWCLAPDIYPAQDLGRDCHPRTGLVLPDLGLPRRMWAGGEIEWTGGVAVGDDVTVETTVRDVALKSGRTGPLGFVTLDLRYSVGGQCRVSERRDIVYREDPDPSVLPPAPPKAHPWPDADGREIVPDATLLFRYSAITFNGHRIHYDYPYATGVEGYDGLVVHGPMQSTWMQHLATDLLGHVPRKFSYRGVSPLTVGPAVRIEAQETDSSLSLRVLDLDRNVVTMKAEASD